MRKRGHDETHHGGGTRLSKTLATLLAFSLFVGVTGAPAAAQAVSPAAQLAAAAARAGAQPLGQAQAERVGGAFQFLTVAGGLGATAMGTLSIWEGWVTRNVWLIRRGAVEVGVGLSTTYYGITH